MVNQPIDLQALLSNGNWVRKLARDLLYDKDMVDDVMQEVWIAALSRPPSKPEALRAWLRQVVRNLSFLANRTDKRRTRREKQPRHRIPQESPAELSERFEVQAQLAGRIVNLEEPYRTIVVLRFYEDLRPTEIAEYLEAPASTVRTQLSRALARLRGELDHEHGDRAAWRAMLVPIALGGSPWNAPVTPGVDSLPKASSLSTRAPLGTIAGMVFCLLVTATLWWGGVWDLRNQDSTSHTKTARSEESAPIPGPAGARPRYRKQSTSPTRFLTGHVPGETAPTPRAAPRSVAQVEAQPVSCPLVVSDAVTGLPVPAAAIYLRDVERPEAVFVGRTDSDGVLAVPQASLCRQSFAVLAPGYVEHREPAQLRFLADSSYEVQLQPEFEATVAVLLPDGSPAAGVALTIRPRLHGLKDPAALDLVTNEAGLVSYSYRYYHTEVDLSLPDYARVTLPVETPAMSIQLVEGRFVRGRVVDSEGSPVVGARVVIETSSLRRSPHSETTSVTGSFDLGCLAPDDEVRIRFYHSGLPAYQVRALPPKDGVWEFEIPTGLGLNGYVLDPNGAPAVAAQVFVARAETVGGGGDDEAGTGEISGVHTAKRGRSARARAQLMPLRRAVVDSEGRFELGPVTQADSRYLFIYHPRFVNQVHSFRSVLERSSLVFELEVGTQVAGQVVSPLGAPLEGMVLHLGQIWSNSVESVMGRVRTDSEGRFSFVGVPTRAREWMAGVFDPEGGPVVREALCLCAFPPDELLMLDGESIQHSEIPGAFAVTGGSDQLRVVASHQDQGVTLNVELRAAPGVPVHTWTPTAIVDSNARIHRGVLGQNTKSYRLYTDHTLRLEDMTRGVLLVMPRGYCWNSVALENLRSNSTSVYIDLEPTRRDPVKLVVTADSGPLAGAGVAVAVPGCDSDVPALIALGEAGPDGVVECRCLAPRTYEVFVAPSGVRGPKEFPGVAVRTDEWKSVGLRQLSTGRQLVLRVR